MATTITDLPHATKLVQTFGPLLPTDEYIETEAVDLIDGDGPAFALISVGTVTGSAIVTAYFQTSPDRATWEAIPGGSITANPVASNTVLAVAFARKHRYVRAVLDVYNQSDPLPLSLLIGQCRKQI